MLEQLEKPVLPALRERPEREGGAWSPEASDMWTAWRTDPASGQCIPVDAVEAA